MNVKQFHTKIIFLITIVLFLNIYVVVVKQSIPRYKIYRFMFNDLTVSKIVDIENNQDKGDTEEIYNRKEENDKAPSIKYILKWIPRTLNDMGNGRQGFIDRGCSYTNCYVTDNRTFLGDYQNFDVIAFSGPEVVRIPTSYLPQKRNPNQKYVFGAIESADNYPVCSNRFDGFFNWTWTYKLSSEVQWGYIVARDINGDKIGPKQYMTWIKLKDMNHVSDALKEKLKTKSKAVAWLVSNCHPRNKRQLVAKELKSELEKYNLTMDIYGKCGDMKRATSEECWELIETDYYFYLSFENSFAEDYVTEKLLNALEHNAVPVVYGGANYTRFMPDGIYLNAKEMEIKELTAKINELIQNPDRYYEYFKWKNHYYYHGTTKTVESNEYCRFCELLNNAEELKKKTVYENFREFWDPPGRC